MKVRSLKSISLSLLKARVRDVWDVGALTYDLVRELLLHPAVTAEQLFAIEEASPHLYPFTEEVWKELCIRKFVKVRIQVEDGKMTEPPSGSWRELFEAEEIKQAEKFHDAELRLREKRQEYVSGRATSKQVDGVRAEKRRKVGSGSGSSWSMARPKTLLEKARSSARIQTSMHAPPIRRPPPPIAPLPSLLTKPDGSRSRAPPPVLQTVRMVSAGPRTAAAGPTVGRPIAKLPHPPRVPSLFEPPRVPPSPSQSGVKRTPGVRATPSLFLPKR